MKIAKEMGLNGLRIHIKPDEPRRLYWADPCIGVLILEDMPNTWQQNPKPRAAWEKTMPRGRRPRPQPSRDHRVGRVQRDLGTCRSPEDTRRTATRRSGPPRWSRRSASSTRHGCVEDNSPCNYDHIAKTDFNSWHFYIDDHRRGRARAYRKGRRCHQARERIQLLPGPVAVDPAVDQFRIRRRVGRRRRPRYLVGLPGPDHAIAPASQDPGIRLHRAGRHRVGA